MRPLFVIQRRAPRASLKIKSYALTHSRQRGARVRDEIFPTLKTLQTTRCPFKNLPETRASRWGESLTAEKMEQCRWIKPKLVCQVAFVEWTDAWHLRHCTFVGMRDDKKASEVVRET